MLELCNFIVESVLGHRVAGIEDEVGGRVWELGGEAPFQVLQRAASERCADSAPRVRDEDFLAHDELVVGGLGLGPLGRLCSEAWSGLRLF